MFVSVFSFSFNCDYGFLMDLECDHLNSLAKSELQRSAVAVNLSGKSKLSEVCTSSGMLPRSFCCWHRGQDSNVDLSSQRFDGSDLYLTHQAWGILICHLMEYLISV